MNVCACCDWLGLQCNLQASQPQEQRPTWRPGDIWQPIRPSMHQQPFAEVWGSAAWLLTRGICVCLLCNVGAEEWCLQNAKRRRRAKQTS